MGTKKVILITYACERCNHEWQPKSQIKKPKVCPKCHNAWWDTPKKDKVKK